MISQSQSEKENKGRKWQEGQPAKVFTFVVLTGIQKNGRSRRSRKACNSS
jgi:hypothetical protein